MSFILQRAVRNWYLHDVSFSAVLIESFVDGVEKQAAESIVEYEQKQQTFEVVDDGLEEYAYLRTVHQGLDDTSYNLELIFHEYFPSLQRSSALITLCSYFEHELDKLCLLYQSEKAFRLGLSDLKGKAIDRSAAYLEKVVGLNVCRTSQEWIEIKNIQMVRNALVHNGRRVRAEDERAFVQFANKVNSLSRDDAAEIVVGSGFLSYVVQTYGRYFKLLHDSILEKENISSVDGAGGL